MTALAVLTSDEFDATNSQIRRHRRQKPRSPIYMSESDAIGVVALPDEQISTSTEHNEATRLLSVEKEQLLYRYSLIIDEFANPFFEDRISENVKEKTKALIILLLLHDRYPKIAPDEAGALVLSYDNFGTCVFVTLEDEFIHAIIENNGENVFYDDVVFDGTALPNFFV